MVSLRFQDGAEVLVAASREADEHDAGELARAREGVRRLERRDDALETAALAERGERFPVGRGDVLRAAGVVEPGVLGADAGVVEAGADRVGADDLAVPVLE